mmetsp:Transcript_6592/g.18182  ORF Transcript_6592/g.18182 Transcript_6592/m.18182 type:complete len:223 (-) Transcript_6592:70-738(-)
MVLKTVGKLSANDDNTRQLMFVPAPVELKLAEVFTRPDAIKAIPMTSNKFDKIEPINDCCTTLTRFALMAFTVTIISTALPKVALSKPPTICPVCAARASVAAPRMAARGTMAMKFKLKVASGPHSILPEQMPRGTKTKRRLMGWRKISWRPRRCRCIQDRCSGGAPVSLVATSFIELSRPMEPNFGWKGWLGTRDARDSFLSAIGPGELCPPRANARRPRR